MKEGFEVLMKGKDHVVWAMAREKAMLALGNVRPETVKAEQHRTILEPGSGAK